MSKRTAFLRNKWKETVIAAVCALVVIVTVVLYSISTAQHIFSESSEHLEEIATQVNEKFRLMANNNRNMLNGWKHYVNDAVDKIKEGDTEKETELRNFFSAQDAERNLTDIFFISEKEIYNEENKTWTVICKSGLSNEKTEITFQRSINTLLNNKKGGVLGEKANGEKILLFAADYKEKRDAGCDHKYVYKDGEGEEFPYRAVGIGYDAEAMRSLLAVDAFDGKGICYIVRDSGLVILQVGSPREGSIGNYLDFLGNRNLVAIKDKTIDEIKEDFTNYNLVDAEETTQCSDTFLFYDKEMDVEYYLTYQPIGFDNWMFLGLVPSDVVNGSMNNFQTQTILVMAVIFIIVGAAVVRTAATNGKRKVTEKEKEIRSRDNLLDLLTINSNDIFILFSPDDFAAKYVSTNITQVLGLEMEDVKKDIHTVLRATIDTYAAFTREGLKGLPTGRTWEMDMQMQHVKTKELYWFHMTLYHSAYNREDSFILMLSDRTKEHKMSESLEEALQIAKSANEAKSNFLSNMSHDIRTPMNAIVGFSTLLAKDADKPDKVREYVRKISFSSQHLLSLINDILDMSKIESGKTTLNTEDFNLPELFEELYTMMSPQAKAKQQNFRITTKGRLPESVNGDRLRINQVLINLLSNAIKYTPDGRHIELNVEALEENISNHAHLRITVKDDGIGMSEEFTKEIFEPFAREVTARNKGIQGTGLGMAITKNIVDLMGGTISVKSEIDKGSIFTLELELLIAGAQEQEELEFWTRHNITHVLVVDNDEDICLNVQALMDDTGVGVDYALSGRRAIEMVDEACTKHDDYHIILLDWKMPEMDGIETARQIRKRVGSEVPIMVLTSYNFDEIEEEAKSVGIDLFLSKPFFVSNFRNAIEKLKDGNVVETEIKPDSISLAGLKVLAAEDNEINAEILVDLLEIEKVRCEIACNGREALEKFESSVPGQYDFIFMDVQMPVMNGYEATAAIRRCGHPEAKTIPVIAMTANAFEDDVKQALDSGMNAHLAKPIDMDKLKLIVDDLRKKGR